MTRLGVGGDSDMGRKGLSSSGGRAALLTACVPSTCVLGESELIATVTPMATAAMRTTNNIAFRNRSSAARIFF